MFLCRLNPSCPFSCSAVDPSWHFSAGVHRASCHWQTGTLQLQYPEETRDQKKVVLLFLSVCTGVLLVCLLSRSLSVYILYFCCFPESEHIVHIIIGTHSVIDNPWKELESQISCVQMFLLCFLYLGVASEKSVAALDCKSTVHVYCWQLRPCLPDWLWSWLLLSYNDNDFHWTFKQLFIQQLHTVVSTEIILCFLLVPWKLIFFQVTAVMVDGMRPNVHHCSVISSITESASGLTNLFWHNEAD